MVHARPALRRLSLAAVLAATLAAAPAFALTRDPAETPRPAESLEGNFLAAYVAGAARDTGAAATFYREAIKEDPRNQELLERAFVAFLSDGSMQEAFRAAERLVAADRSNALAQFALGVRAIKARQFQTARANLSSGGRGRQADVTATILNAWTFAAAGDGKRALDTLDKLRGEGAVKLLRDYQGGLIAQVVGNAEEAERRLKAAYDAERTTLQVVDAYARLLTARGLRDEALAVFESYDRIVPRHPLVRAAIADLRAGKPLAPAVANAMEGAGELLHNLSTLARAQGDELTTIIYLRLALHLSPDHPLALVALADAYEDLKQYERANEIYARVPKDSALRMSADITIGTNYERMERGEEAVKHLEALHARHPNDVDVLSSLGNVLRARKRFAEAAAVYTKALDKADPADRGNWLLHFYRGTSYERAKEWPKAEADLKKALELMPENQSAGRAQVLNYLAYSWVDRNENIEEAFKMLKRAVELAPRDGMIIDSLGWAYYRMGRYEDAVRELERAVELKAGDPVINDHLGDAYWRVGRRLEAKFQWNHAVASNPEPEDLVKILQKIDNGLPDDPKPAEADATQPAAEPAKNGG